MRIDTHLHLWDSSTLAYPWLEGATFPWLPKSYLLQDVLDDGATGDTRFVVVQAEVDHASDPVAETAWLQSQADQGPNGDLIVGFVAYADLGRPDVVATLERHARHPLFRGIRQEIWWEPHASRPDILEVDLLQSAAWRQGFGKLAEVQASFDLTCWHWQLDAFAAFLSEYPEVPVIVDHLGSPVAQDESAMSVWRSGIEAISKRPNTFMKISGLSQVDPDWSADSLRPIIDHVLTCFGVERCMLGSNFPVEKGTASYTAVWQAYDELFSDLTEAECRALYHETARRAYRLSPPCRAASD